jgi:hypothetical protein
MIVKLRKGGGPGSTAAVALWHKKKVHTHTRDRYKLLSLYTKYSGIKYSHCSTVIMEYEAYYRGKHTVLK